MSSRRPIIVSERSKLDPFVVATGDASPRDQRDLMERPFFSLAKGRRIAPILYEAGDVRVEVYAVVETFHGGLADVSGVLARHSRNWLHVLRTLLMPELWIAAQVRRRAQIMAWTPGLTLDYCRALRAVVHPVDRPWFKRLVRALQRNAISSRT